MTNEILGTDTVMQSAIGTPVAQGTVATVGVEKMLNPQAIPSVEGIPQTAVSPVVNQVQPNAPVMQAMPNAQQGVPISQPNMGPATPAFDVLAFKAELDQEALQSKTGHVSMEDVLVKLTYHPKVLEFLGSKNINTHTLLADLKDEYLLERPAITGAEIKGPIHFEKPALDALKEVQLAKDASGNRLPADPVKLFGRLLAEVDRAYEGEHRYYDPNLKSFKDNGVALKTLFNDLYVQKETEHKARKAEWKAEYNEQTAEVVKETLNQKQAADQVTAEDITTGLATGAIPVQQQSVPTVTQQTQKTVAAILAEKAMNQPQETVATAANSYAVDEQGNVQRAIEVPDTQQTAAQNIIANNSNPNAGHAQKVETAAANPTVTQRY